MKPIKSKFEEFVADCDNQRVLEREALSLGATEIIASLMESENISRSALAKRLKTSKSNITQLLSGGRNMTLHTFSDILFELGCRVSLHARPLQEYARIPDMSWKRAYSDRVRKNESLNLDVEGDSLGG